MFSWSKQRDTKQKDRGRKKNSEEDEFGIKIDKGPSDKQLEAELRALAGVDELQDDDINLNEEEDEESELLRLIGGRAKKSAQKQVNENNVSATDVLTDITAEIDLADDVEVDENDPDLLNELLLLTGDDNMVEDVESEEEEGEEEKDQPVEEGNIMSLLKERIKMYKTAEMKAKENNESSRARRFNRGLKTLENLLKKVKAGGTVSESDIPPVIALNLKPLPSVEAESVQGESQENKEAGDNNIAVERGTNDQDQNPTNSGNDIMKILLERLKTYQIAETKAKEANETSRVRRFTRGIKTLENLIKQAKQGGTVLAADIPPEVALNLKPPPPPETISENPEMNTDNESYEVQMNTINLEDSEDNACNSSEVPEEENIMQTLFERLELYKSVEEKARVEGETSRVRRFNRGIKILLDLIEKAKAGEKIPFEEIPPLVALNLKQSSDLNDVSSESKLEPIKFTTSDDDDGESDSLDEDLLDEKTPTTVMEGLEQRLRIYNKLLLKAKERGNDALVEENEKIINIYENSIKTFKSGGFIDVLKLPTPRGCPPIPIPFQIV